MKGRINLVHYSGNPGGIEILIPVTVRSMKDWQFNCFIIRPPSSLKPDLYYESGIPVTYGDNSNIRAFIKLWQYANKHKNEVFHVFNIGPFFLLVLRLAGVEKVLYSIRGTIYWKNFIQFMVRKFFWKIAIIERYKFIANSDYSRECFINKVYSGHDIIVVYNPLNNERLKNNNDLKRDPFKIIYAGRIDNGKNLFRWLDVAAYIHKHLPAYQFELYGTGSLVEKLREYSEQLGLFGCVSFMGFTDDIGAVYRRSGLVIFLSEYESFGNVVVESILSHTPVIASSIPSMKEIFKNYPDFLVNPDENLEVSILNKIGNIDKLTNLTLKAAEEFRERFSLEKHINTLNRLYAGL